MVSLCRLLFTSFIWHIWSERNAQVFWNASKKPEHVLRDIFSMVYTRCMFLGIHVPSNIERRWNFPPFGPLVHPQLVQELVPKEGCWMSIVHVTPVLVGVLWLEMGGPELSLI